MTDTALTQQTGTAIIPRDSMFLDVARFEFSQRVATMLAQSSMVPKHFQGSVGNCMIVMNLSDRLGMDVFGLMQTSYVVHGRPGFESKLIIALFSERTKLFIPPLRWETKGGEEPKGKEFACRAWAIDKVTNEKTYGEWIDWPMVQAEGWDSKPGPDGTPKSNKWKTMPGQMFRYRAAAFFIRVYEPGLILGMQTIDELEDTIIDVTPSVKIPEMKADGPKPDAYKINTLPPQQEPEQSEKKEVKEDPAPVTSPPPPAEQKETTVKEPEQESTETCFKRLWSIKKGDDYVAAVKEAVPIIIRMPKDAYSQLKGKWLNKSKDPWPIPEAGSETGYIENQPEEKKEETEQDMNGNGFTWCDGVKKRIPVKNCANCHKRQECQDQKEFIEDMNNALDVLGPKEFQYILKETANSPTAKDVLPRLYKATRDAMNRAVDQMNSKEK